MTRTVKRPRPKRGDRKAFVKWFRHWRSGKIIRAEDYGLKAFAFTA